MVRLETDALGTEVGSAFGLEDGPALDMDDSPALDVADGSDTENEDPAPDGMLASFSAFLLPCEDARSQQ